MRVKATTNVDVEAKDKKIAPLELAAIVQSHLLQDAESGTEIVKVERTFMGYATVTYRFSADLDLEDVETDDAIQPAEAPA